jgi:hypothetical protein
MHKLLARVVLLACLMLSVPVLAAEEDSREGSGWRAVRESWQCSGGDVGPAVVRRGLITSEPEIGPQAEPNG